MYFVDRNRIEETLIYMDELLEYLTESSFTTTLDYLARERMVHIVIESILDVGNMMIDGFIMRDPGSYDDIIDILVDEKVIPAEQENAYKEFIGLRRIIVTEYKQVDQAKVEEVVNESIRILKEFSTYIRTYLKNELGVANAFIK